MDHDRNYKKALHLELSKSFQIYGEHYMQSIFFLLKSRKDMFVDINSNFHKINTLTFCSIVMFFSYVENTGISIKRLLEKALNSGIITVASKKKQQLIVKDESKLSFEETMKLTFSVYPSLFGERNHYGDIKNNDLKTLRILRDIRNSIVHPKGIEDVFVTLKQLEGKDINLPMISYIKALQNLVNTCAKKI